MVKKKLAKYADTTYPKHINCLYLSVQVFGLSSTLLVVFMSVDRLIAVKYPLRASTLCTTHRAYISSVIMFAINLGYNVPYFIYSAVSIIYRKVYTLHYKGI